jgi:hypothetical protein
VRDAVNVHAYDEATPAERRVWRAVIAQAVSDMLDWEQAEHDVEERDSAVRFLFPARGSMGDLHLDKVCELAGLERRVVELAVEERFGGTRRRTMEGSRGRAAQG